MKTKSKILLALAFLTAGTIAAASTSTFAWFTTTRSVALTYSTVSVINKQGNLQAKIYKYDGGWKTKDQEGQSVDTNTTISELSSADGVTFAKPKWDTVAGGKISGNGTAEVGVDYSVALVEVKNTGVNALSIYLDNGTKIAANSPSNTHDAAAANLSRVAINAVTGSLDSIQNSAPGKASGTIVFENDTVVTADPAVTLVAGQYIDASSAPVEYDAALKPVPADTYFVNEGGFTALTASNLAANSKQQLVANLAKDATAYFVVTVWLEGTKETGAYFNSCVGGKIDITLNLTAFEA